MASHKLFSKVFSSILVFIMLFGMCPPEVLASGGTPPENAVTESDPFPAAPDNTGEDNEVDLSVIDEEHESAAPEESESDDAPVPEDCEPDEEPVQDDDFGSDVLNTSANQSNLLASSDTVIDLNDKKTVSGANWDYDKDEKKYNIWGDVTFKGSVSGAVSTLYLDIHNDATVYWSASYSSSSNKDFSLLEIAGGTFHLIEGGSLKRSSKESIKAIDARYTDVIISGGKVSVGEGAAVVSNNILVTGGIVEATAPFSEAIRAYGEVTITGGVIRTTKRESSTVFAFGDVTVTGGSLSSKGEYGITVYAYGDINISGVSISAGFEETVAYSRYENITLSGVTVTSKSAVMAVGDITIVNSKVYEAVANGNIFITDSICDLIWASKGGNIRLQNCSTKEVRGSRGASDPRGDIEIIDSEVISMDYDGDAVNGAGNITITDSTIIKLSGVAVTTSRDDGVVTVNGSSFLTVGEGGVIACNNRADVVINGGEVRAYNRTSPIRTYGNITINGGVVIAENGYPFVSSHGSASETAVVNGGFVFAAAFNERYFKGNELNEDGDGIICLFDNYNWAGAMVAGTSDGLSFSPGTASVVWDRVGSVFGVRYENGENAGFIGINGISVFEPNMDAPTFSITPVHSVMYIGKSMELQPVLNKENADYSLIEWSSYPEGIVSINDISEGVVTAASVTVKALDTGKPGAVQITAVYDADGITYTATASIEILKYRLEAYDVKLLGKKVTINKAKTSGALLPILITQARYNTLLQAGLEMEHKANIPAASSVIDYITLMYYDKYNDEWHEIDGFTARICPTDARYIEIKAEWYARSMKNVWVVIRPKDGFTIEAGMIELKVIDSYPKITVTPKTAQLNMSLPGSSAEIAATSPVGQVSVVNVFPKKNADIGKVEYNDGFLYPGSKARAGKVELKAQVVVEGYYPIPEKYWPSLTVNVTDKPPGLKLSSNKLTLLSAKAAEEAGIDPRETAAEIALLSSDKNLKFQSNYSVEDVVLDNYIINKNPVSDPSAVLDVSYDSGIISIYPKTGARSGTAVLRVKILGSMATTTLNLSVAIFEDTSNIGIKPSVSRLTVNTHTEDGAVIADFPVSLSVSNLSVEDYTIQSIKGPVSDIALLNSSVDLVSAGGNLRISVKSKTALSALRVNDKDAVYSVRIGSPKILEKDKTTGALVPKCFTLELRVTSAQPSFTVALKNKIDTANPDSFATATIKLSNMDAVLASVTLLNMPVNDEEHISKDFTAVILGTNTFIVKAKHNQVVPGVTYNLRIKLTLTNGQELYSWTQSDKPVKLTPVQLQGKVSSNKKSVTLNKSLPFTGDSIEILLPATSKNPNLKLGMVCIQQASLKSLGLTTDGITQNDGFEMVRSGENTWTIHFKDGLVPQTKLIKGKQAKLKSSYTIKLEVWAEGTYMNIDGIPVALTSDGVAKTKPALISVKVNIK